MIGASMHTAALLKPPGKRPGASRALALLNQVSQIHRIDVKSLKARVNYRHFNQARRDYCQRGLEAGIGIAALADVLCRDRTTIIYHQRPDIQVRKREQRLEAWRKKKNRIAEDKKRG